MSYEIEVSPEPIYNPEEIRVELMLSWRAGSGKSDGVPRGLTGSESRSADWAGQDERWRLTWHSKDQITWQLASSQTPTWV